MPPIEERVAPDVTGRVVTPRRGAVVAEAERPADGVEQILARVPRPIRPAMVRVMDSWLVRTLLRALARLRPSELLDRSMGIAAELFTSIFPIVILAAVWLGRQASDEIAESIGLPNQTRDVLHDALNSTGPSAFGVAGSLLVLISATSLSRALTRAFAAIWELPRPKRSLRQAWRLLAAVIILVAGMLLIRWLWRLTEHWPLEIVWQFVVPLLLTTAVGVALPWILLSGAVPARRLIPGAVIFGLITAASVPLNQTFLANALEDSAARYGSIGVAFTYIAFLYISALCFLGAALVGQTIATDDGRLGRLIRGEATSTPSTATPSTAR